MLGDFIMRRIPLLLLVVVVGAFAAYGQVMINNFDNPRPDTAFSALFETGSAYTFTFDAVDKIEGTGSLKTRAILASQHAWGTYAQVDYSLPTATPLDWTISDSLSIWVKVTMAPVRPANIVFRISLVDQPNAADPREEWVYENLTILDNVTPGWVRLRVQIKERTQPASNDLVPDSTGFILPPGSWGLPRNNAVFDRNKIVGWKLIPVSGTIDADSVQVSFDKFERYGVRAFPAIIFTGRDFTSQTSSTFTWGQSGLNVEQGGGPVPNSNAIKWVMGNEWGNGWTGWGCNVSPAFNLAGGWTRDSVKFKMKAEAGVDTLRVQFESANGKRGKLFKPLADNLWHSYAYRLSDFTVQDNLPNFDSSTVTVFGIMAEHSAIAGKIVYITEVWTGNPNIDVIPPPPPTGLAVAGVSFNNLITWNDVPNEPGVRYNVFFKDGSWTSVSDSTVEDLPFYNLTAPLTNHPLRSPNTDQTVSYRYGVTAKDLAGNESTPLIAATPTTTLAKGVPTIAKTGPVNFVANGTLTEWSTITPFNLSVVTGTAHAVPNFPINGDNDLSVKAYLATDAQYLYVAFDVVDDTVAVDTSAQDYQQDCPDLCIGLYDWRGKRHSGYRGGATPDYHFRFSKNRIWLDNGGVRVMSPGVDYIWKEKTLTPGYTVEARIPWTTIAGLLPSRNDVVFVPREGKRIAMNLVINDRDNAAAGGIRTGIMDYSYLSNDNSWSDMYYWTHTWIGNQWTVGVKQTSSVAQSYQLGQNYPNPFNPTTQIKYSIAAPGMVTLRLFDVLGREVATLVNDRQEAGSYTVNVDLARTGKGLSSGVYFYRLESGSFSAVNKMMMLK